MTNTPMTGAPAAASGRTRRRAARRRKTARKAVSSRKGAGARSIRLDRFVKDWARRAAAAGVTLGALSGGGVEKARAALEKAGAASRKTLDRLSREWKQMDPRRKAQVVAALLAALAAASAPLVRSRMKKR